MDNPPSWLISMLLDERTDEIKNMLKFKCNNCSVFRRLKQNGLCDQCYYDVNECDHQYLELTEESFNTYRCVDCKTPFEAKEN